MSGTEYCIDWAQVVAIERSEDISADGSTKIPGALLYFLGGHKIFVTGDWTKLKTCFATSHFPNNTDIWLQLKPRLKSARLTEEDEWTWARVQRLWGLMNGRGTCTMRWNSEDADRRDARIMRLLGAALGNKRPPEVHWLIICCAAWWNEPPWWDHSSTLRAEISGDLS